MFVKTFKKIYYNLSSVAGFYEERTMFVPE